MPHVLIADDDETIRHSLQTGLVQAGHSVALAADGIEALQHVREGLPDLMVLDVMMPRKDGFEVLKELKAQPHTASVPLVMLVARAATPNLFDDLWSPGNYFVTKPFSPTALTPLLLRLLHGEIPTVPLDRLLVRPLGTSGETSQG